LANYKIFYVLVPHIKDENNDVFKWGFIRKLR
jgi:hypothetical protein